MRATTPAFGPALAVGNHRCSCGRPLDADGNCYRCDRAGFDPDTSEADASACTCSSDEFARPACAVHGKAVS